MSTKSKAFDPLQHEADVIAKIEAERESMIALRRSLPEAQEALDEAEAEQASVEARIAKGDRSVSVEDLQHADAAFRYTTLAYEGVQARVSRVKRKPLPSVDKRLVEAVAPAIGRASLGRIPVHPTVSLPKPESIPADALPVIYVAPDKEGLKRDSGGVLGGGVDIMLVRDVMGRVLDSAAIFRELGNGGASAEGRKAGFVVEAETSVHTNAVAEGVEVDRTHVVIQRAWNTTNPVIETLSPNMSLAAKIAGIGSHDGINGGVRIDGKRFVGPWATAVDAKTDTLSEMLDGSTRTAVVRHTVNMSYNGRGKATDPARELNAILNHAGLAPGDTFLPGIGLVQNVSVERSKPNLAMFSDSATITVTATSRVPEQAAA